MAAGPYHRSRQAGFMLTEMLATFAISAFILLGLVSTAPFVMRFLDRSVSRMQNTDDLGRTLDAIARDLAGLMRARWNGVEPQAFVFRGGPNTLFFARRERSANGPMEIRVIALREIVVAGGTRLVRAESPLPVTATSFDDLQFGPQRPLETGTARLRFWYVPARKGDDQPTPRRSWDPGSELPDAIIVEAVAPTTKRIIVAVRIPIRANADIGCIQPSDQADTQALGTQPGAPSPANPTTQQANPGVAAGTGVPQPPTDPALAQQNANAANPGASGPSATFCSRDSGQTQANATPPPAAPPGAPGGPSP